jgi:hypothetical protein
VKQGEDVGSRMQFAQGVEHLLAAAHPGQPVVDQGDSQRRPPTSL